MNRPLTQVIFEPTGSVIQAPPGAKLLDLMKKLNLNFIQTCGGKGKCGKCKVRIEVELPPQPTDTEMTHLSPYEIREGYRLACAISIPEVPLYTVRISPVAEVANLRLQMEGSFVSIAADPLVRKYLVKVPKYSTSIEEMLLKRLKEDYDLDCQLTCDALKMLPLAVSKGKGKGTVTSTLYNKKLIISVELGDTRLKCLGFAADIGTTKLAGYLMDLNDGKQLSVSALANPQMIHGDDVMSRITFSLAGKDHPLTLQKILLKGINSLIEDCCSKAIVNPRWIYESCFVGNPCMMHLLLGLSPKSLAFFPYQAVYRGGVTVAARNLPVRLKMHQAGRIYVLPLIAGYVGADTVAAQLAAGHNGSQTVRMVIDIGTNTEIVLSDKNGSLACSCASGPAFEGMHISYGRKADSASIEEVSIDPETLEVSFKTIGEEKPAGLCGSGVISAIAELLRVGIISPNGKINGQLSDKSNRVRRGNSDELEFVIAWNDETAINSDIVITQSDIHEIQKAKAAIYAGCTLLMRQKGITEDQIDEIIIAGAFGQYLNKADARAIRMLPNVPLDRFTDAGNAAGTGAKLALISRLKRQEAEHISKTTKYYELALADDFFREYGKSMLFPQP